MPRNPTERPRGIKKPIRQKPEEAVVVDVVVKTRVKVGSGQKRTIYPAEALEMIRGGDRNGLQKLRRRGYSWEIKDGLITVRRKLGAVTAIEIEDAPMVAPEQDFVDSPFGDLAPEPDFEPLALPATSTTTFSGRTDDPFDKSIVMGPIEEVSGASPAAIPAEPQEPPPPPPAAVRRPTPPPRPSATQRSECPRTNLFGSPALVRTPIEVTTAEESAFASAPTPRFGTPAVSVAVAEPDADDGRIPGQSLAATISAPAVAPAEEAPIEKSFAERVKDLETRVDAFESGKSEEKLDDLLEVARQLSDISGTLIGDALTDADSAIPTLGQLHARLDVFRRKTAPRTKAERSAAPAYFLPGSEGNPQPPTAAADSQPPNVQVPAMEEPTTALSMNEVKIANLETRFELLNKQAQDLLKDKPISSGADVPTIIESCETLQKDVSDLLKSLATKADPNKGLIGRLKTLNSTIEGLLLSLRHKQQNGREEQAFQGKPLRKTIGLIATAVAAAIGLTVIAVKTCKDNKLLEQKEELEIPEVLATSVPPAPAPVSSVPANAPDTSSPTPATEPDLNLDPVGAEQPAQKTATFNCEIDTKGQEGIKCVDQNAPDANVIEELKWTGEYNSATQTVPAELVLTTSDGQQFKASFDAQIGTRQELSWTLEAIE